MLLGFGIKIIQTNKKKIIGSTASVFVMTVELITHNWLFPQLETSPLDVKTLPPSKTFHHLRKTWPHLLGTTLGMFF